MIMIIIMNLMVVMILIIVLNDKIDINRSSSRSSNSPSGNNNDDNTVIIHIDVEMFHSTLCYSLVTASQTVHNILVHMTAVQYEHRMSHTSAT